MLEPFHEQVGYEQKRDEVQRVRDRIGQHVESYIGEFVHMSNRSLSHNMRNGTARKPSRHIPNAV